MLRKKFSETQLRGEEGHALPALAVLLAAAGMVIVGIGAANGTGWLAVVGGIVAAAGLIGADVLRHSMIDKEFYRRTDELMKK
jgi:hypothetical protein